MGACARGDGLARQCDDTLDEVVDLGGPPPRVRAGLEHHDVAAVHVVQVVAHLVDEDAVTHLEGGDHRPRGDVEGLEEEGLDEDRDDDRDDDEHAPLGGGAPPLRHLLAPWRRAIGRGRLSACRRIDGTEPGRGVGLRAPGDGSVRVVTQGGGLHTHHPRT